MEHFGTIQSFNEATGKGFIRPEDGGPDLSFERSEILWDPSLRPRPGLRLSYRLKGRVGQTTAINLRSVESAPGRSFDAPFTIFRSAAEEAATKAEHDQWDNEGGHMSSTAGHARRVTGAALPYVVTLQHHRSEDTDHPFATMRECDAFIRRNTPQRAAALSTLYDQPASDVGAPPAPIATVMTDDDILAELKVIDGLLRRMASDDAASVWATGLASTGIPRRERLRLLSEIERILDERGGESKAGLAL